MQLFSYEKVAKYSKIGIVSAIIPFMNTQFLERLNLLLSEFFSTKQIDTQFNNFSMFPSLHSQIKNIIFGTGAERLRPKLVSIGYTFINNRTNAMLQHQIGTNRKKTMKAIKMNGMDEKIMRWSLSIELFHTAALIHDDIMDNAKTRRGVVTIHEFFREEFLKKHSSRNASLARTIKEAENYGRNMAILAGDLCLIWADELFYSSNLDQKAVFRAKPYFDSLREEVVFGQTMDLSLPLQKKATEDDILKMYEYKTARYSLEKPLLIGAALVGADDNLMKTLSAFAIPVGIAFQIHDDILGVFGENTGKDADSDIKEGKMTLLAFVTELRIKNHESRIRYKKIIENRIVANSDIAWVKGQMVETGALKYCQKKAKDLVDQGKKALIGYNGKLDPESKQYLLDLADKCVIRNN